MKRLRTIQLTTDIRASQQVCFDLSRSIDLHLESMARSRETAVAGVTSGLIGAGEHVTWEANHFGIRWRATSRIVEFEPPCHFVDEMITGPFSTFRHEHLFESIPAGTRQKEVVEYRLRGGLLGRVAGPIVGWYLRRLLLERNELIKARAEKRSPSYADLK